MTTRRQLGFGLGTALSVAALSRSALAAVVSDFRAETLARRLAEIETRCGGRLGVGIFDTESGVLAGHRAEELFPMCSTHKALSAAAILARVDQGEERLDRRVRFAVETVLAYSPATKAHAGPDGMTIADICQAAVTLRHLIHRNGGEWDTLPGFPGTP